MTADNPIGDHAIGDSDDDDFEYWTEADFEFTSDRIPVVAQARQVGCQAGIRVTGAVATPRLIGVSAP